MHELSVVFVEDFFGDDRGVFYLLGEIRAKKCQLQGEKYCEEDGCEDRGARSRVGD